MSVNKRLLMKIIILAITSVSIFTIFLDFSRLFESYDLYNLYPNEFIKRINVILAAFLVWLAEKDSLSKVDNIRMKFVFIAIFFGEVYFLLAKPTLAILFFAVCHCLLVSRHCRGLRYKLTKASQAQKLKLAFILLALISILFAGVIMLYNTIKVESLLLIAVLYGLVLSVSLWVALASFALRLFPYKNSKMIALGMLCFYFCDITVGLDGLLWSGPAWLIATSLTWVFYTPALTLLALSNYKY